MRERERERCGKHHLHDAVELGDGLVWGAGGRELCDADHDLLHADGHWLRLEVAPRHLDGECGRADALDGHGGRKPHEAVHDLLIQSCLGHGT